MPIARTDGVDSVGRLIAAPVSNWSPVTLSEEYSFLEKVELVAKNDFISYAAQAGLSLVDLKGDYNLSAFDELESPRMIFIWAKN